MSYDAGRSAPAKPVTTKELQDYGMLAELLGRLPVVVELGELGEQEMIQVLTTPPDSVVKEYTANLALDDVTLKFDDSGLRAIVRHASERKLGARGLRGIMEQVCHDLMFEAPDAVDKQQLDDLGLAVRQDLVEEASETLSRVAQQAVDAEEALQEEKV